MGKTYRAYTIESDNGVQLAFHCPGCGYSHAVWVRRTDGKQPCWEWNGELDRVTISPSIRCISTYGHEHEKRVCHSFVRDGHIQFLGDCTHALAGQTVPIPVDD